MKKVYLLLTAICLTALTGCVKEEPYTLEEATIEVNLDTRSGEVSEQQGDKIEDVMIWVFRGGDENNWGTLAGWRTYTPPTDAYAHTSLTLHIPVALCDGNSETYRLVAVLNQSTWGNIVDADGEALTLNSETTYAQLIGARFANQALIEQAIEENTPGTPSTPDNPGTSGDPGNPEAMPVSHWCDVVVKKENTHANNKCAVANLDVFRSVAKTQLFVTKASNDFSLEITGVTVNAANKPTEGMVLSSLGADGLKAPNAAPAWFGTNAPAKDTTNALSQSLKKADGTAAAVTVEANAATYTDVFVGSAFLYENAEGFTVNYASYDYTTAPTGSNGYYLTINYTVDGDAKVGYVPLPAAVRNHDYQVYLTVEGGGKLDLTLKVNEWKEKPETHNYLNEVSIPQGGQIQWTSLPSGATNSDGVVTLGNAGNLQATCTFFLNTPANGTWQAELVTVEGQEGAITFADGTTKASGAIAGSESPATLTIKTTRDNLAINGAVSENKVELRITATATVGGVKRTYKVTGLTGITGVDYYTIVQTR